MTGGQNQKTQAKNAPRPSKGASKLDGRREQSLHLRGKNFDFYHQSAHLMHQCGPESVSLTVTSPPYWNAIDYDIHARHGGDAWHRERQYSAFGETIDEYLNSIGNVFGKVLGVTVEGGFCAIIVGTILHKRRHYPTPMLITSRMLDIGWEFHQDIIWNKVTGGVNRARSFIRYRKPGYYYPNIMTEYILIFRRPGEMRRGRDNAIAIDDLFTREIANNIWHIAPVPPGQIDHPCPFPEELARRLVLLYSERGDTVLDPFLGSGQTALAAVREGRKCVGFDMEAKYVRLAARRMRMPPARRKFNLISKMERIEAAP